MKNLKRIFSLALAGTMLAGMLTVGASAADFTDADSIKNSEAVDTMVALNIINGKDDGSFAPEATVTRAEMAKMITIMLNGGNHPTQGSASSAIFSDINGPWARSYNDYWATTARCSSSLASTGKSMSMPLLTPPPPICTRACGTSTPARA